MRIPYINLQKQYKLERKKLLKIIDKNLSSGLWVGNSEVDKFENNIRQDSFAIQGFWCLL